MAEVKPIHQKLADEQACRRCGNPNNLDPAHTIPRSLHGKNNYDSVIPLCRHCHDCQHGKLGADNRFELLPLMTREEQVEAVRAIGLARAYRYLTNNRRD